MTGTAKRGRAIIHTAAVMLACGLSAGRCAAQVEGIIAGDAKKPLYVEVVEGNGDQPKLLTEGYTSHPWSVDLLIGLPSGVRVQRYFDSEKRYGLMAEAFVGVYTLFPFFGGGFRYGSNPWSGKSDIVSINPGVGYYGLVDWLNWDSRGSTFTYGVVAFDVDIMWKHIFSDAISGEIGFKVGIGTFYKHDGFFLLPLPIVSLIAGLRF